MLGFTTISRKAFRISFYVTAFKTCFLASIYLVGDGSKFLLTISSIASYKSFTLYFLRFGFWPGVGASISDSLSNS